MVHIGNDWDALLTEEFEKPYYLQLRKFLVQQYRTVTVYPAAQDIFNALRATAYRDVKVVILGQDPYHEPHQAHGMCFSVQPGTPPPPSLQNIFREISQETGLTFPPDYGYLMHWAEQGVLLLNTVLTVQAHRANSHKGKGWEILTDRIIALLNEKDSPVVFLLWGANARSKKALITNPKHLVLESVHPSPLSADQGFFGCGHFTKTNEFLSRFTTPIDWSLT